MALAARLFRQRWHTCDIVSPLSLKFRDAKVEAAYKAKIKAEVMRPTLVSSSFVCAAIALFNGFRYLSESGRADLPFSWEPEDPRTFYFIANFIVMCFCFLYAVAASVRICFRRLASWNWEAIATCLIAAFVCSLWTLSAWHTATIYGAAPEVAWGDDNRDGEFVTLLEMIAVVTGVSIYIPIRACIMWIIPMCAITSYIVVVTTVGSPFPQATTHSGAYLAFLSFVSYQGARNNERKDRQMWHNVRQMSSMSGKLKVAKKAYEEVASAFCETVVKIGVDGCVEDSDRTHEAFFGRKMSGLHFTEILQQADRDRFARLLQQASELQTRQSMPATLDLRFATTKVQLVVVDANAGNAGEPSWLVGVHSAAEQSITDSSGIHPDMLQNMGRPDRGRTDPDQETHLESLPTTTDTGLVFAGVGHDSEGDVRHQLECIAAIGAKEHWLINPSEMELLPDRVLGTGGFGVVIVGRMRGTPVAVKLPRWTAPGRTPPSLASISNELRLHRHIRHPNVVLWHGACIHPQSGHLALVNELVNGVQLDTYVYEQLGESPELLKRHKLLMDVACALRFLHAHRPTIVHGDLKPNNILVEQWAAGPRAKVLDFGLSQLLTKCAEPLGGTLEWMPPELFQESRHGRKRVAPSADVFAFGRLCYFICTGAKPLHGFQRSLIMHMARQGRPVPLRWATGAPFMREGSLLCDQCLSHRPEQRPSAAVVRETLTSWLPCSAGEQLDGQLDVGHMATYMTGTAWSDGVKALEASTGGDFSSDLFSDTAKDRGRVYLDQLEALVEGADSDQLDWLEPVGHRARGMPMRESL